jgi:hypothetical protein
MKCPLQFGIGIWLVCVPFLFSQSNPSSTETKLASSPKTEQPAKPSKVAGPIEILSDTMGVDFGPYLQTVVNSVKQNWYNLIPESARAPLVKKGRVLIQFAILKDGTIAGMNLVGAVPRIAGMKLLESSGDVSLDDAAWAAITVSNPFSPLPVEFSGPFLALRFSFYYNPATDVETQGTNSGIPAHTRASHDNELLTPPILLRNPFTSGDPLSAGTATEQAARAAAVRMAPIDVQIPLGSFLALDAFGLAARETANPAVKWNIVGQDCSDGTCGTVIDDLYIAPTLMPSSTVVTVKAISDVEGNPRAWVRIHLIATALHK